MGDLVTVARRGPVATVTLDRPPLNLLDPELIAAVHAAFRELTADAGVRVAVLTGRGRAFTGGMNVRVLHDLEVASAKALITSIHAMIAAVHHAPFPVVARVNGFCLGAGFELALACDLRVAATGARLGLPEVRVGVPSVIEAALLPGLVGPGRAAEMLLTGESVTAEQAEAWGLVNRTAPLDELDAAVDAMVERLLAVGPRALRLQKELMLRWRYTDLATAMAVLEKRAPRFGDAT
jgi:enoyl-CoA hydratase/carnithine racemase